MTTEPPRYTNTFKSIFIYLPKKLNLTKNNIRYLVRAWNPGLFILVGKCTAIEYTASLTRDSLVLAFKDEL